MKTMVMSRLYKFLEDLINGFKLMAKIQSVKQMPAVNSSKKKNPNRDLLALSYTVSIHKDLKKVSVIF